MLQERTIADKMDRQLTHRSAARSVIALAAMLAHEIKNPLSGIRGAAQLLEQQASSEDRLLTRLICDEADRIVTLVDRMEVFGDDRPVARGPVNQSSVGTLAIETSESASRSLTTRTPWVFRPMREIWSTSVRISCPLRVTNTTPSPSSTGRTSSTAST